MKGMIKDSLILFAITIVAGLLLGYVNEVTKTPIAQAKEKAKQEAYQNVFVGADSFENVGEVDMNVLQQNEISGVDVDEVMYAKDSNGNLLGYVLTITDHEGYGGDIQFSMGITLDGTLNGISLLSISETAGLGMEAEPLLVPQFADKKVDRFTYTKTGASESDDTQIDAISGATITTKAIVNGVNAGLVYFQEVLSTAE